MITPFLSDAQQTQKLYGFDENWLKSTVVVVFGSQYGTGWWVNNQYVVTAAHVVNYQSGVQVTIVRGNMKLPGTVVAADSSLDVAVIYVTDASLMDKTVLRLARKVPDYGSTIFVIGYPYELLQITGSIESMSSNPRVLQSSITWYDPKRGVFEVGGITDAGNSGGPVLDYSGNVIGLVSFALTGEAGTLYFASDVENIKVLLQKADVSWSEGNSGPAPENPVVAGAIAGATASIATDVIIILLGVTLGAAVFAHSRRRR